MILETKNLTMSYKQGERLIPVLSNLNLQIESGVSLSITGTSGSGKTTLLSLLAGLERPCSGDVFYNKKSLTEMSSKEISQYRASDIGIVFQQFHLLQHLTALENVSLPLEINGDPQATNKAIDFLKQVGLEDRIHHYPNQLSGGECQRVAIARAFVHSPKIIFADEPTGNLDLQTSNQIMELLFKLISDYKMTLILITHDLDLAQRTQRKISLKEGTLV